ncbi:MAG: response regulator [Cyanobacteria bacterium P01_G01_bin.67]
MHRLTSAEVFGKNQSTVLVVEDNEDNLIYLAHALNMFGYNSIATQDSRESLTLALQHQPDLIIFDIKMPNLSGIDLFYMLKCDWPTRHIPVIAVTALAKEQEKKLILDVGFKDYLVKPFYLEELRRSISSHNLCTV